MNFNTSWQILDNWDTLFNDGLIASRVGLVLLFAFVVCLTAFLNLVFSASNVLEVLFWTEVLLIGSVFAVATAAAALQLPVGFVYGFFLLNATAVEAAVGMAIVVRLLHLEKSIMLTSLRQIF